MVDKLLLPLTIKTIAIIIIEKNHRTGPTPSEKLTESAARAGFVTGVRFPEIVLDFSIRKWRLLDVILRSISCSESGYFNPDVIGLQEVDTFHNFFQPVMKLNGYEGIWMPKPRSPAVKQGWYSDGCALFWNTTRWELVQEQRFLITKEDNQVAIFAVLRHLHTKQSVLFVVTHLKANRSHEQTRTRQAKNLAKQITENYPPDMPVVLVGDLNASPPPTHPETLPVASPAATATPVESPWCLDVFLKHGFHSTYSLLQPSPDMWTSCKYQENCHRDGRKQQTTKTKRMMVDYILFRGCLFHVRSLRLLPNVQGALPNLRYPSDHAVIAAKFQFGANPILIG